ncbi:MAG: lysophospholipid acyltransferase family protein [Pseudomonadota bacterium]|nr:lysophospholipid acyltransferase family protein [Pseudomonadota bacterium]
MPTANAPSTLRPLSRLLRVLSRLPLGVLQQFARMLAGLFWLFPEQGMLKTIRRNLILVFPDLSEPELRQLTKYALRNQLLSFIEFLRCWGNPPSDSLARAGRVTGQAILEAALADPKGCVAIVPHYGSWELMNAWLNQYATPVVMYKPSDNLDLDQFVLEARSRMNQTMVPTDDRGVRLIFRALKNGGLTIILPDHTPKASGGIASNFCGYPVLTTTLASKLIQKTGCSVVMLSCIRNLDTQRFDYTIDAVDPAIYAADLQTSVDTMNAAVEALIRRAPEHYHWAYKRFKAAAGFEDIYQVDEAEVRERVAKLLP